MNIRQLVDRFEELAGEVANIKAFVDVDAMGVDGIKDLPDPVLMCSTGSVAADGRTISCKLVCVAQADLEKQTLREAQSLSLAALLDFSYKLREADLYTGSPTFENVETSEAYMVGYSLIIDVPLFITC